MELLDSIFVSNREDVFGYLSRNLKKGQYQIHIKKYGMGAADTYDFTTRIYAPQNIHLIDVEEHEIRTQKEKLQKRQQTTDESHTITESSNPNAVSGLVAHFTKAGD